MPASPTSRMGLQAVAGADAANTIDTTGQTLASAIDSQTAIFSQGVVGSRPTSTPGTPGKTGRFYYATDTDQLFYDFGTGWKQVRPDESLTAYKTEARASGDFPAGSSGTFVLPLSGGTPFASPFTVAGINSPTLWIDDADYTISGRNTRLRVRAVVSVNGTAPTSTFTVGLYPVTFSGGASVLTGTLGAVVASSTAAVVAPAINASTPAVSADFAVPADGHYVFAVVVAGAVAASSKCLVMAQLQQHYT